ncbi:hypothetical protein GCM10027082_43190 [Comamonas humi]
MKNLVSSTLAALSLCTALPAFAARDFTPQPGTWVVSSELDGKPGRGLAIDVQGNTLFMQVFNYEQNGDATFHASQGPMDGNTMTAPLVRYRGGRSFGGEAREAVEDGSPGSVTVSFANGLQGTVQFPGEAPVAMERLVAMGPAFDAAYVSGAWWRQFNVVGLDEAGQVAKSWQLVMDGNSAERQVRLTGRTSSDLGHEQPQALGCTALSTPDTYACRGREDSLPTDGSAWIESATLRIVGADVQGVVSTRAGEARQHYVLTGMAIVAADTTGFSAPSCAPAGQVYTQDALGSCSKDRTINPSNGTWIVADELTGKPGRGIALDVQNGMAIAQVFNYLPDGRASFHMGSGAYTGSSQYAGEASTLALNRYAGGRYFGGPATSAALADSTGTMQLQFNNEPNRVEGMIQFPGEPPRRIVRLALEPDTSSHHGLLGEWVAFFWPKSASRTYLHTFTLTRDLGDAASTSDGSVRCQRQPHQFYRNFVACDWRRGEGADTEVWSTWFTQQTNNRSAYAMQIRDRHGNLLGLGDIPLR